MDDAAGLQKFPVTLQKQGRRQAGIFGSAKLRVGESEPDGGNFIRAEESLDELDAGTEKSHIGQGVFGGVFCSFPEAGAFDIHADVIVFRMPERQGNGVITAAAAQFQYDGTVIPEHFRTPSAFDVVVPEPQFP